MSLSETFLSHLPDSMNKLGTNIQKIARFVGEPLDDVQDLYRTIDAWRAIDKASGKALDRLGEKYGQARGRADDEFYRVMIKSKIIVRSGDATTNGILRTIQSSLNVDAKDVKVTSIRGKPTDDTEPLAIRITNIPLEIAKTAWEQNYLTKRIQQSVAAGVRVDAVRFFVRVPSHIYMGSAARWNRTLYSRSSLLDNRALANVATQTYVGAQAQVQRDYRAKTDVLTDRVTTATVTMSSGSTVQQTRVFNFPQAKEE